MLHQSNTHSDLFLILLERLYHQAGSPMDRARMIKPNQIKSNLPFHFHTMAMQYADVEKRDHKPIKQEVRHEDFGYLG
jgi:hypothetical protein